MNYNLVWSYFLFLDNAKVLMQAYNECHQANIQIYRFYVVEQVQYYERLSPLVPLKSPLGSFSNIKAGDCLVTFSRRGIYTLKVGMVQLAIATLLHISSICMMYSTYLRNKHKMSFKVLEKHKTNTVKPRK